jgi:hypothetical protein
MGGSHLVSFVYSNLWRFPGVFICSAFLLSPLQYSLRSQAKEGFTSHVDIYIAPALDSLQGHSEWHSLQGLLCQI